MIKGPIESPLQVTFPMAFREVRIVPSPIAPQMAQATFEIYSESEGVRYPGFRYPGVYTFKAQAFDGLTSSPEITMTITVTDDPAPPPQSIQAMIVSGATHPDDVFGTGTGVAEAMLKGGIFTLGTTNLVGTGRGPLRFEPDQDLLSGQKIPPFIPWFYDVREVNYRILAKTSGGGVVPLRNATGLEAQRLLAAPNQTPFPSRPKASSAPPSRHEPPKAPTPQPVPTPAPVR